MKQLYLQAGCSPFRETGLSAMNTTNGSILSAIIRGCAVINDTSFPVYVDIVDTDKKEEPDSGAVMYIVAVLVFYSAGIVTMIIKYLKREKQELEEEKILDDFFRSMPAYKKEREQNKVNRYAIHAFHALTSVSYDDDADFGVTTDDEDDTPVCTETIHEIDDPNSVCLSARDINLCPETTVESELSEILKERPMTNDALFDTYGRYDDGMTSV